MGHGRGTMGRKHPRSCSGKKRYRDEQEAKRALRNLATNSSRDTIPVRWYECANCHGYHITKQAEWSWVA
jgi:hypothetical protein